MRKLMNPRLMDAALLKEMIKNHELPCYIKLTTLIGYQICYLKKDNNNASKKWHICLFSNYFDGLKIPARTAFQKRFNYTWVFDDSNTFFYQRLIDKYDIINAKFIDGDKDLIQDFLLENLYLS